MKQDDIQMNADFLSIALEEMDADTVEYEFVQDVYENLLDEIDE